MPRSGFHRTRKSYPVWRIITTQEFMERVQLVLPSACRGESQERSRNNVHGCPSIAGRDSAPLEKGGRSLMRSNYVRRTSVLMVKRTLRCNPIAERAVTQRAPASANRRAIRRCWPKPSRTSMYLLPDIRQLRKKFADLNASDFRGEVSLRYEFASVHPSCGHKYPDATVHPEGRS